MEDKKEKVKVNSVFAKLLKIRESVSYLQKEKHEGAVQFKYVSSSATLAAVREAMNKEKLVLIASITHSVLTPFTTKNGAPQWMTELSMTMTWVDATTGDEVDIVWYGQGVDNSEKGVGKALTYAEKYFILKQFNIPTDSDDPDKFQDKHETTEQKDTKKAELIAELKVTNDLARVTVIWKSNQYLKADKEFKAAVGAAGKRLKPAEEPAPAE